MHTLERFRKQVSEHDAMDLDKTILDAFQASIRDSGMVAEIEQLIDEVGRKHSLDPLLLERARDLTARLRNLLAQASVHALEPDLIILDEFQRFRHLLDLETGGEAAELAHHLFEWDQARTLLLSATPYKPFTLTEEDDGGEDHYTDLMTTLGFLCSKDQVWLTSVRESFADYRGKAAGRSGHRRRDGTVAPSCCCSSCAGRNAHSWKARTAKSTPP